MTALLQTAAFRQVFFSRHAFRKVVWALIEASVVRVARRSICVLRGRTEDAAIRLPQRGRPQAGHLRSRLNPLYAAVLAHYNIVALLPPVCPKLDIT